MATNLAPYKIKKLGGKWCVVNNAGETKASFGSDSKGYDDALAYQRALYVNVPGAQKKAASTPFTGKEPLPKKQKAGLQPEDTVPPHDYIVGGTGTCLLCGRSEVDPLHDDNVDLDTEENLRESLSPSEVDLKENADVDGDATSLNDVDNDDDADKDEENQTGVMVALFPSQEVAQRLRLPGGEKAKNIHLTLAYLGDADDLERPDELLSIMAEFAKEEGKPLSGEIAGIGVFTAGEGKVTYASVDLPGLPAFRQALVQVLDAANFKVSETHGFTPHMTLAYNDKRHADLPNVLLDFDTMTVAIAGKRHTFLLGEIEQADGPNSTTTETEPIHGGGPGANSTTTETEKVDTDGKPVKTMPVDTDKKAVRGENVDTGKHLVVGEKAGVKRGWFGAAEKADTFYFEHDWKPVPGHPAEVATCDVCGLNRYSDEHKETAGIHKKHKYVHPNGHMHKDAGMRHGEHTGYGYGYPPCAACGASKDDPDHEPDGDADDAPVNSGGSTAPAAGAQTAYYTAPRVEPTLVVPDEKLQRAFLADINGRTLLTAPASLDTHGWEKALTPNEHFMWMQGKFVGGEEPNRNKAFWSTEDLEMGEPTVAHGPLNWLHESRHIIGTIADQRLVKPNQEQAAEGKVPYIAAVAGVWKWIYPDEAYVIEQASDSGKLWYSMECISKDVQCVGDNGCGATASYGDYMKNQGDSCNHMRERSAVRRFVDPTFLGGAVIVPPVRPGWADADARVMREAASLAEKSFAQVHPDATSSEWELLMASVVRFAGL